MKKKLLIIMFVIPVFLFLTGCNAIKKTQSLKCSVTMSEGFEQYGEISYYTSTKFDGTNNVTLDIDINFTKITLNATQLNSIEKQMNSKFCNGLFSSAPTCESTQGSNVIKFHVNGQMAQVYKKFGTDAFNLENVKSYLETTEHMTCAVESE